MFHERLFLRIVDLLDCHVHLCMTTLFKLYKFYFDMSNLEVMMEDTCQMLKPFYLVNFYQFHLLGQHIMQANG